MTQLFEVATHVSTPLMLAGFLAAAFFLILGQILQTELFPTSVRQLLADVIKLIIERPFVFASVVLILGLAGFVLTANRQSATEIKNSIQRDERRMKEQKLLRRCVARRTWIAFFRDDQENLSPVRNTLNTDRDEDWIGLQFTDYDGPRIRLGVPDVVDKSAVKEEMGTEYKVALSAIQKMLMVALYNTKRFDVIEQQSRKDIEEQQGSGEVFKPISASIVTIDKELGAQYLVSAAIIDWSADDTRPGKRAEFAITVTLADATNGRIVFTTVEWARLGERRFSAEYPSRGGGGIYHKRPGSYAIQACLNKAAFNAATFFRDRKWRGAVADIRGNDFYVNAGSQQGMAPQSLLSVFTIRGIIKDGETVLGEDLLGIGTIQVDSVQPGFSIAHLVAGRKRIRKGDRIELASPPTFPKPIPECVALDTSRAP